jgi:thiol-disulfide isomerase/thioredoxin
MKRYLCLLGILFAASAFATEAPSGPAVGTIAPDFKARNLVTGEDITLGSQHGKVVILTFWASWCGPCKRELPILENAQRAVGKDRDGKVVANHLGYGDRTVEELIADINQALAAPLPEGNGTR